MGEFINRTFVLTLQTRPFQEALVYSKTVCYESENEVTFYTHEARLTQHFRKLKLDKYRESQLKNIVLTI